MTALVLSAGGMYGAYQAGAWRALADVFHPDLVVGASIGAVTGWAIAGGCDPDELVDRWLHLESAARYRWKFPRSPLHGVFDTTPLQRTIRDVYESFQPRMHFAMVVTDLMKLRPRVLRGNEVSWQHLVASTAIRRTVRSSAPGRTHLFRRRAAVGRSAVGRGRNGRHPGTGDRCSSRAARQHRSRFGRRHAYAFAVSRACSAGTRSDSAGAARSCSDRRSNPSTGPVPTPRPGFAPEKSRPPQ